MYVGFYSLDKITARLMEEIKLWVGPVVHNFFKFLSVLVCTALPGGVLHTPRAFRLIQKAMYNVYHLSHPTHFRLFGGLCI